jgi:rhamnulokinase
MAIDIGASSGRHVLAEVCDDQINMEVIYRFPNHPVEKSGSYVWDLPALQHHLLAGLTEAKKRGKTPESIGIDTFGVDYVLLDENNRHIGDVFAYRDHRNFQARSTFGHQMSEALQYDKTGIQPLVFNTIYQLVADRMTGKLQQAKKIMLLPSYLAYFLTGIIQNEYTIASTSGLLNAKTHAWDPDLCAKVGVDPSVFGPMVFPGDTIGNLRDEIVTKVGYEAIVYATCSHDTASAVVGSLADFNTAYLSSGTWSLMGVLEDNPITIDHARTLGFTNEGGYAKKIRFLKNIMGLWMVQEVRRENGNQISFSDIQILARENSSFDGVVDVADERFLSPESMTQAVLDKLRENRQSLPKTEGELYYCIFHSPALAYQKTLTEIEALTDKKITTINIVGGGAHNRFLNQLTEQYCKRQVIAGPYEATALGNILVQMLAKGILKDIHEAKRYVMDTIHRETSR